MFAENIKSDNINRKFEKFWTKDVHKLSVTIIGKGWTHKSIDVRSASIIIGLQHYYDDILKLFFKYNIEYTDYYEKLLQFTPSKGSLQLSSPLKELNKHMINEDISIDIRLKAAFASILPVSLFHFGSKYENYYLLRKYSDIEKNIVSLNRFFEKCYNDCRDSTYSCKTSTEATLKHVKRR